MSLHSTVKIASGGRHADNVAPCVFGGITFIRSIAPMEVINLPYPELYCVIVHPHLQVETKSARGILSPTVPLKNTLNNLPLLQQQSAFYQKDVELLRRSMLI